MRKIMVTLAATMLILGVSACKTTLAPGADPVVVYAEQAAKTSLALADAFVTWEWMNRATVAPKVTEAANTVRDNFPKAWWEFRKMTKIYKENRTAENRADLQTVWAVLDRLVYLANTYAPAAVKAEADKRALEVKL